MIFCSRIGIGKRAFRHRSIAHDKPTSEYLFFLLRSSIFGARLLGVRAQILVISADNSLTRPTASFNAVLPARVAT